MDPKEPEEESQSMGCLVEEPHCSLCDDEDTPEVQEAAKVVTDHMRKALNRFIGDEVSEDKLEEIKATMTDMLEALLAEKLDVYKEVLLDPVREIVTEAIGMAWGFGSATKLEQLLKDASDPALKFVQDHWESSAIPLLDMELAYRAGAIKEWKVTGHDNEGTVTTEFVPKYPLKVLSKTIDLNSDPT